MARPDQTGRRIHRFLSIMTDSQFTDTVSDDLIFLAEGRAALLTHPLRRELPDLVTASFCRLLAIVMIQSIEHMLTVWRKKHTELGFEKYFGRSTNEEKIEILRSAFETNGVQADDGVLRDFLAIKYLRNVVIHSRWKDHEKLLLTERGFPEDASGLGNQHWEIMRRTNDAMMFYIAGSGMNRAGTHRLQFTLGDDGREEEHLEGIFSHNDFLRMAWTNIDRVTSLIQRKLFARENILSCFDRRPEAFPDKENFDGQRYKSAVLSVSLEIAKEHDSYPSRFQGYCQSALDSWNFYWNSLVSATGLNLENIERAVDVLEVLHQRRAYGQQEVCSILSSIREENEEEVRTILSKILDIPATLHVSDVSRAFACGELTYRYFPNISAAALFGAYAQIVDVANAVSYRNIAEKAFAVTRLSLLWYSFVERRSYPTLKNVEVYEGFSAGLGAH